MGAEFSVSKAITISLAGAAIYWVVWKYFWKHGDFVSGTAKALGADKVTLGGEYIVGREQQMEDIAAGATVRLGPLPDGTTYPQ